MPTATNRGDAPDKSEMKACPFCGSAPKSGFEGDEDGSYAYVECPGNGDGHFCGVHADAEAEAIAVWNRHASSYPHADQVPDMVEAACEPWEHSVGEPPEWGSPLLNVFDAGINYGAEQFAKALGVEDYEWGDGSDDYAADVAMTFTNILKAAGFVDAEGDLLDRAAIAALQAVPAASEVGWQPIESAPKGRPIIGRDRYGNVFDCCFVTGEWFSGQEGGDPCDYRDGWYRLNDDGDEVSPAFWLPYPHDDPQSLRIATWIDPDEPLPEPPALQAQETGK